MNFSMMFQHAGLNITSNLLQNKMGTPKEQDVNRVPVVELSIVGLMYCMFQRTMTKKIITKFALILRFQTME